MLSLYKIHKKLNTTLVAHKCRVSLDCAKTIYEEAQKRYHLIDRDILVFFDDVLKTIPPLTHEEQEIEKIKALVKCTIKKSMEDHTSAMIKAALDDLFYNGELDRMLS